MIDLNAYRAYKHSVACAVLAEFGTTVAQVGRWIVSQETRLMHAFRHGRDVTEVAFEVVEFGHDSNSD